MTGNNHPNRGRKGRWQPIETAPKDAIPVIGAERIFDGSWNVHLIVWHYAGEIWREGWVSAAMTNEYLNGTRDAPYFRDFACTPTHWMPLPSPPSL